MSNVSIEMFPALEGDCILLTMEDGLKRTHILIDGGYTETYEKYLKPRLLDIANLGEHISLVIVTHIDSDHIEGILELLKENNSAENPKIVPIDEIWHNSYRHLQLDEDSSTNNIDWKERAILSDIITKGGMKAKKSLNKNQDISAEQGSTLAALLYRGRYKWNLQFDRIAVSSSNKKIIDFDSGISIRLLSPNNDKLKKLRDYWLNELQKEKYDFKLEKDELFDDAYEFYLMSEVDIDTDYENREISSEVTENDLKSFLNKKNSYDSSPANGSSISFILEYQGKKLLFLGDSHPTLIKSEIENLLPRGESKLFFDLIKVSHHGSHRNTSKALLDIIDSNIFLLSSNGGRNKHPDKETIARIVCRKTSETRMLVFNYLQPGQPWNEKNNMEKYNYDVYYPDGNKSTMLKL